MKDSVIIYSGGMDSTTLLYQFQASIGLAISFDYGSNHNDKEFSYAEIHTKKLGIEHIRIDLKETMKYFKSGLLEGADAIPEGHYSDASMAKTVVPFRNGIMLSIAAGIADSRKLFKVLVANHFGDSSQYPDCRFEFVQAINKAVVSGTDGQVRIIAPYTDLSKEDIAEMGYNMGINYSDTWSCYKADEDIHCGKCGTCVERIWALRNFIDTTKYKDKEFAIKLLKEAGEW